MSLIWGWISKHWSSVLMGLLLCWVSIGVTYVTFIRPSIKTGTYIEASTGYTPTIGVDIGTQYFGCAHMTVKK